jgi:hypothetical protein
VLQPEFVITPGLDGLELPAGSLAEVVPRVSETVAGAPLGVITAQAVGQAVAGELAARSTDRRPDLAAGRAKMKG